MEAFSHQGHYRLLGLLSAGGMGEVFLARREGPAGFSKTVVVKRILRHLSADASAVELFLNEARLAALLSHPNVVQIFELGQQGDDYFLAMEYVRGRSLRAILQRAEATGMGIPVGFAVAVAIQALRGLHYAHTFRDERGHALGIVHRDVGPENLLVAFDGHLKVVDFGIAQARLSGGASSSGVLRGKLAYMAPEQRSGRLVDARADVYALGVVLHELLGGTPPDADGASPLAVVPEALASVIRRALAPAPGDRFTSAREMLGTLESLPPGSEPYSEERVASFLVELFGPAAVAGELPLAQPIRTQPLLITTPITQPLTDAVVPWPVTRPITSSLPVTSPPEPVRAVVPETTPKVRRGRSVRAVLLFGALLAVMSGAGVLQRGPSPTADASTVPAETAAPAAHRAPAAASSTAADAPGLPSAVAEPLRTESQKAPASAATVRKRPRSRRTPPPAPAEAHGEGALSVRVHPWAEVELDGRSLGLTPLSAVPVTSGRHQLVLRNPELGLERKLRVTIRAGAEVLVKEDLLESVSR